MSEETIAPPQNKVIVIGMVDTMLVRDRTTGRAVGTGRSKMTEITHRALRNRAKGGRREELTIQARSPYGGMFAIKIDLEPDVPGAALIDAATADELLAFEGCLQLTQTFDERFAGHEPDTRGRVDRGLPTRAMRMLVTQVRQPTEQEQRAASAVWLEGTVMEPPQISRHPELPAMQLAGTILQITYTRPADFPGLPAMIAETVEVNVVIPVSHQHAGWLYRQGNRVRIIGQLDCRLERQGGRSVTQKLAEIDAAWEQTKAQLMDKPIELRRAEQDYRRLRMRFEESPRLFVMAGYVELLDGAPMALEETFTLRRAFVAERRRKQHERRERIALEQAARAGQLSARADASVVAPVVNSDADGENGAAAATVAAKTRPRRNPLVAAAVVAPIDGAELADATEPATHELELIGVAMDSPGQIDAA